LKGHFNFCVPLLGFCENYKRIVVNARPELILIARNDNNCLVDNSTMESQIELFKIQWRMPHFMLNKVNILATSFRKRAIFEHEFPFMKLV